jgi:hypothetical protein
LNAGAPAARAALVAVIVVAGGCGPSFDPPSLVESVRILSVSADKPYAMPGEGVTASVLAVDGRVDQTRPMRVHWLPKVCANPQNDDYWECYPSFAGQLQAGVDLTDTLVAGDSLAFAMPTDAIRAAQPHPSAKEPYGVVFAFVIACAGEVEYRPLDPSTQSPSSTPFGCFDEAHRALGPDDFVFAFKRIYAFADRRNANPAVPTLSYGGAAVDPATGIPIGRCTASDQKNCAATAVDARLPDSSWEIDPADIDANGKVAHETIWVDYYATAGRFAHGTELLFDAHSGRISSTADGFGAPRSAGLQRLWAVVQDNRGGSTWVEVPLKVN